MSFNQLVSVLDKTIVVNPTQYYSKDAYYEAIDIFLKTIPINEVLSVYQVGSIGAPGLSDIDLFLIMKDKSRDWLSHYSIKRLRSDYQYLFSHEGWLMDEATFQTLPYWFPYFELNHIFGKKLKIDNRIYENPDISLILILNYLLTKVPSDFLLYSCLKGQFHERVMIAMVNSLIHLLKLWKRAMGTIKDEWQKFMTDYPVFRLNWFKNEVCERQHELKIYVVQSVKISMEIIESVDNYLINHWGIDRYVDKNKTGRFCVPFRTLHFQDNWNVMKALNMALSTEGKEFSYPSSFQVTLKAFAKSKGLVGKHIQSCLMEEQDTNWKIPEHCASMLECHINAIEAYAEFHAHKFRAPASGYHTYWAPHTRLMIKRNIDLVVNAIARRVVRNW